MAISAFSKIFEVNLLRPNSLLQQREGKQPVLKTAGSLEGDSQAATGTPLGRVSSLGFPDSPSDQRKISDLWSLSKSPCADPQVKSSTTLIICMTPPLHQPFVPWMCKKWNGLTNLVGCGVSPWCWLVKAFGWSPLLLMCFRENDRYEMILGCWRTGPGLWIPLPNIRWVLKKFLNWIHWPNYGKAFGGNPFPFTWSNGRSGKEAIFERLDRGVPIVIGDFFLASVYQASTTYDIWSRPYLIGYYGGTKLWTEAVSVWVILDKG